MKECFGNCGSLRLKWSNRSAMHYIVIDEEKMEECDQCPQFAPCAWRVQLRLFKQLIKWSDEQRHEDHVSL